MSTRKSINFALGFAIALGAPLVALGNDAWERTNDESDYQLVAPKFGTTFRSAALPATKPLQVGDISPDRQYVYLGEEGGWQIRPMSYRLEGGRFVHVDDPVGHMERHADTRPLTEEARAALQRSGGS